MEFVLVIITSYGLHAKIAISEVHYDSQEQCEAALKDYDTKWTIVNDDKFAYTMRCEARARG